MKDYVYPIVVLKLKAIWRILGFRFSFKGQENLKVKGGAVIAMNHVGYLDFAFVGTGALPAKRYIRFMAKKSIFDHKISGPLMRGMHHISVDRENGSTSFVAAMRALRAGELVGIFPLIKIYNPISGLINILFLITNINCPTVKSNPARYLCLSISGAFLE